MAGGLMQATGMADPSVAPPDAPVDPQADDAQGTPASPEEQDLYDNLVARCYVLMFEKNGNEKAKPRASVVQMLRHGDPKQALGETAAQIFFRVEQAAEKAGQKIPGDVKEQAGAEVFSKMAELATKVGVADFTGDDDLFNGAFVIAANELQQLESQNGMQDPEETSADFDQLMQADRSGQLAAIVGQGVPQQPQPQPQQGAA